MIAVLWSPPMLVAYALIFGALLVVHWLGRVTCPCRQRVERRPRRRWWPSRRQSWDTPTQEHPVVPAQRGSDE